MNKNTLDILEINQDMLRLIPANTSTILEIGCGSGATGLQYKLINPHCHYIGIENDLSLAEQAKNRLDEVIIADIANLDQIILNIPINSVSCLILNDQIPYFVNPLAVLQKCQKLLKADAQILAIIPNLQYWQRVIKLIQGEWQNSTNNIVNWFDLDSLRNLFNQANLFIYELQVKGEKTASFQNFLQLIQPLTNALNMPAETLANKFVAESYIVLASNSYQSPRRLLIQTIIMAPTGCDQLRVLEPDRLTATIPGVRAISAVKTADTNAGLNGEEKVFIWQRTIMTYQTHINQLKSLLEKDYLIVAEIDDNPIRRKEYAENNYLSYRGCHCVQTTTEPLGKFLQEINPNVAIFPNQLAYLPPAKDFEKRQFIHIFFGALNRENDWQPIMLNINKIIDKYQQKLFFHVVHDQLFFDSLNTNNKQFTAFCPYAQYKEIMYNCDIALLPLNDNPINAMKSDLKFIECAGHSVVAIASPTVYENSIIDQQTGFIYKNPQEFEKCLKEMIINHNLRQKVANNAYEWVKKNRLLSQHYYRRYQWYLQMRNELPRLNAELRERVPELFS
ncbi:MAG: methyltransferase domain-containing protein [Microcoleaceae cyanobacterium]